MLMCLISSTLLVPPMTLPSILCTAAIRPQDKIEAPMSHCDKKNNPGKSTSLFRLKFDNPSDSDWSFLRPESTTTSIMASLPSPAALPGSLGPRDSAVDLASQAPESPLSPIGTSSSGSSDAGKSKAKSKRARSSK